ncbi:5-hydroxytryptamine receptor 3A [Prionailurus iriomotensis]
MLSWVPRVLLALLLPTLLAHGQDLHLSEPWGLLSGNCAIMTAAPMGCSKIEMKNVLTDIIPQQALI